MTSRTLAAALGLALLSAPASAQPQAPAGDQGPLTQLFVSPCGEPFRAPARAPYPVAAWFAKADANHDGAIDKAEFRADADAFFDVLDVDHDGVLMGYEVSRYERLIVPEIRMGAFVGRLETRPMIWLAQADMGPGGIIGDGLSDQPSGETDPSFGHKKIEPSREGAAAFNLLGEPEPVTAADGDFNGRITKAEFEAAADRRFRRLDTGGQGKLTLANLPRTIQQQRLAGRRG